MEMVHSLRARSSGGGKSVSESNRVVEGGVEGEAQPSVSRSSIEGGEGGDGGGGRRFAVVALGLRAVLVVVILAVAFGMTGLLVKSKKTSEVNANERVPVAVRAVMVESREIDRVWEGFGTVRTMIAADIVAEVAGRVVARPAEIEPGSSVRMGDLIVQLDDADYANAYESARLAADALQAQINGLAVEAERIGAQIGFADDEIEAAMRDLERTENAIAQGAGSSGERDVKLLALRRLQREQLALKQQLDLIPSRRAQLMAQLGGQRANERTAKENQRRAKIVSPLDGDITSVSYRVGDWAGNGSVVARVVDLSKLEVPLRLPASSSSWVRVGDSVSLWIGDAEGEAAQSGRIVRIAPEADAGSRTITVYVEVEQDRSDSARLLPGQFVLGRVRTRDPNRRVVLPRRAVQDGFVFVAVDDPASDAMVIDRFAVRASYGFDGRIEELDRYETQWIALDLEHEPAAGSAVVVTLLDQLEVGMRVILEDGEGESP